MLECCVIGSLLGSRRTPRAISQKRNCLSKRACFARKPRPSHCTSLTWLGQRLNTALPLASSGLHALAREESLCQVNGGVTGCRGCVNWLQKRENVWGRSRNQCHSLIKFMLMCCFSPNFIFLLHKTHRRDLLECDRNHHPCIFQAFGDNINL